jgi:hypothetical protein
MSSKEHDSFLQTTSNTTLPSSLNANLILQINESDVDDFLKEIKVDSLVHRTAFKVAFKELVAIPIGQASSSLALSASNKALSTIQNLTASPDNITRKVIISLYLPNTFNNLFYF